TYNRVQFTADLLPSDVVGLHVFNQRTGAFELRRGPVFADVLLADEINRATPRTQSGLLECMEERQVTIEGVTLPLPPT
ncbi:AAA family ATPase, partial [Anoxybacillus sp. LAT_38]|nr:AAA family ATPase [Anoxybacillus sp. LAT_38]